MASPCCAQSGGARAGVPATAWSWRRLVACAGFSDRAASGPRMRASMAIPVRMRASMKIPIQIRARMKSPVRPRRQATSPRAPVSIPTQAPRRRSAPAPPGGPRGIARPATQRQASARNGEVSSSPPATRRWGAADAPVGKVESSPSLLHDRGPRRTPPAGLPDTPPKVISPEAAQTIGARVRGSRRRRGHGGGSWHVRGFPTALRRDPGCAPA